MADGFPLVTTRNIFIKGMIHELLWFLSGDTNIYYLHKHGVKKFWHEDAYGFYTRGSSKDDTHVRTFDEWCLALDDPDYAKKFGSVGMIYPRQWRNFTDIDNSHIDKDTGEMVGGVDQIADVLESIKTKPESRYHVVTAWNPSERGADKSSLPPCHMLFMFNCRPLNIKQKLAWTKQNMNNIVASTAGKVVKHENAKMCHEYFSSLGVPDQYLDLDLTQRSVDSPLGLPVNIASYALMLHIFAKLTGMIAGEFIWCGKDVHIYENQFETAKIQLTREPRKLPKLILDGDWKTIDDVKFDDIKIVDYDHHPILNYPLSTGIMKK
jgi:thymidylate synthase